MIGDLCYILCYGNNESSIVLIAIVVIIVVIIIINSINNSIDNHKFNKQYESDKNDAISWLNLFAMKSYKHNKIKNNPQWKSLYLEGFSDGKMWGDKFYDDYPRLERFSSTTVDWQEYSEYRFNKYAKDKTDIERICGGDVKMAKFAYDEGRKYGIMKKNGTIDYTIISNYRPS